MGDNIMGEPLRFASRMRGMTASEIRELLKLLDDPAVISFAGGIPAPELFPTGEIGRISQRILADPATARLALQYSVSEGYRPLRSWLAELMSVRGVQCSPENIVITSGSQQALDLIGRLFLDLGDRVLVTAPTYLGALQAFSAYEPKFEEFAFGGVLPASSDEPHAMAGCMPSKLAYVVPDFCNPTGATLSEADRRHLLSLVEKSGAVLIEDAAYEALRYEGVAERSCLSLDVEARGTIENSRVLYCGTFSKTLAPGLRVGWVCGPSAIIRKIVVLKQASDLHSASFNQMIVHAVAEAIYDRQVSDVVATYRKRRDAMLGALEEYMPAAVTWTRPQGGMFVWVTLPEGTDASELLRIALKREQVAFVPGAAFFAGRSQRNHLRLSFSTLPEPKIREGIARLAKILGGVLQDARLDSSISTAP